jgi:Sigma-70, region 4
MGRPRLTLEKELLDLLGGGRGARIAARYHGFDGRGGETLQSVGKAFGVTRERIRQIVAAASAHLRTERPLAQALDRTIAFVADRIPAGVGVIDAGVIEAEMRSKGLTAGLFRIESVVKATELLGRRLPFTITQVNGARLVHTQNIPPLLSIVHLARRVVAHHGIATISNVAAKLRKKTRGVGRSDFIANVLARDRSFRWLDSSREWFWSETGINPVLHRIRKILAVVNPIHASDLMVGIVRSPRMKGFSPPIEVLLEFCRQAPGLHVRGDAIEANPMVSPNEVLSQIERQIVHTLSQNGGTLTVLELKSACLSMGLNQTTCYLYLGHSPFIGKCGHNRYGLIGSGKNPVNVASLSESTSRAELSDVRRTAEPPLSPDARQDHASNLGRARA